MRCSGVGSSLVFAGGNLKSPAYPRLLFGCLHRKSVLSREIQPCSNPNPNHLPPFPVSTFVSHVFAEERPCVDYRLVPSFSACMFLRRQKTKTSTPPQPWVVGGLVNLLGSRPLMIHIPFVRGGCRLAGHRVCSARRSTACSRRW